MANLRCGFDETEKLFIPSTECVLMLARRIFIGLSVPTAPAAPHTKTLDAFRSGKNMAHKPAHTHTRAQAIARIDNLAISAKAYYTEIRRHEMPFTSFSF